MKSDLLKKLDQIEAEMKRIGYWQAIPAEFQRQVDQGEIHYYLDAPSFELWLQAVFLPNARRAAQTDNLPTDSEVGLMALRQYDYQSSVPEAQTLLHLLQEFDVLIDQAQP